MAELVVARITLKLAWRLFAPQTAARLENGDVAEEKLRQMLLSEFNKIHEHLNALRRKELVAAVSFLETGFELLQKDEATAKEEFKKARDAALMAFGVVPDVNDKVLATKLLVTSTFHEFNDNTETSKSLCLKYLERMNTLPEVVKACQVIFTPQRSLTTKLMAKSGKAKRDDILVSVAEINKCVHDYFTKQLKIEMSPPPVIRFDSYHINPVNDMILHRKPTLLVELESQLASFIAVTMSPNYIFAAVGQISGALVTNDIIAINLESRNISHLLGHEGLVLTLCSNEMYLFSGSYDKTILVWDLRSLQPIKTLTGHTGSIRSICNSEKYLFTSSTDTKLKVWSLENDFECIQTLEISNPICKITCSRRKFLFCLNGTGNIQIWDIAKFTLLHAIDTKSQASSIIANDNFMFVPVKNKEGESIQCWNLGSLTNTATINEPGKNLTKPYNSPYIFCGYENVRMISTTSQRVIMEQAVTTQDRRYVGTKIKYMWMQNCHLFVLSETSDGINFILKY